LVNYQEEDAHWKLKLEIGWRKEIVSAYLLNFDQSKFHRFTFENTTVYTGCCWQAILAMSWRDWLNC
jgi:hypothetical protein